jgi:hypothetical protein
MLNASSVSNEMYSFRIMPLGKSPEANSSDGIPINTRIAAIR